MALGAVVEWSSLPSAFDSVDGSINSALIACTNDYGLTVFSGSRVEVGTTIVTCQTYDSAGNTGYCHFSINVQGKETLRDNRYCCNKLNVFGKAAGPLIKRGRPFATP